jgi:uncharacterized membrane protein YccF (DUF307 family)
MDSGLVLVILLVISCVQADYVSVFARPVQFALAQSSLTSVTNGSVVFADFQQTERLWCNMSSNPVFFPTSSITFETSEMYSDSSHYCQLYIGVSRFLGSHDYGMVVDTSTGKTVTRFSVSKIILEDAEACGVSTAFFKVRHCAPKRHTITQATGEKAVIDVIVRYNKRLSVSSFLLLITASFLVGVLIALVDWKITGTRGRSNLSLAIDLLGNSIYFAFGGFFLYLSAMLCCACWYLSFVGREYVEELFQKSIMFLVPFGRKCEVHALSARYAKAKYAWFFSGGLLVIIVDLVVVVISCLSVVGLSVVNKHLELVGLAFNPFKRRVVLSSDEILSNILSPRSQAAKAREMTKAQSTPNTIQPSNL